MKPTEAITPAPRPALRGQGPFGLIWLALAALGAVIFLYDGIAHLPEAWQTA